MASTHHLVTARRILGEPVFGSGGEKLGKIEDLMIDKVSGKALYALLAFDGFMGIGAQYYPVPWSVLEYEPSRKGFVAPLTHAQLETAHSVTDAEVEKEIEWRERIHEFYGATPYWPGLLV